MAHPPRRPLRALAHKTSIALLCAGAWFLPSQAWALDCEQISGMLDANVPPHVVIQAMAGSGASYEASDIRCLADAGAPPEVIEQARAMAAGADAPAEPDPTPEPDQPPPPPREREPAPDRADVLDMDLDSAEPMVEAEGPVEELIRLFRNRRYRTSSKGFFDLLKEEAFPDAEAQLQFFLARSLQEMDMFHSAQHYYMQVVRRGPSDPYFNYALPRLVAVSQLTGNDTELMRIVHRIPPAEFPRGAQNHLYYLLGRRIYEEQMRQPPGERDLARASQYFEQVSPRSEFFGRAKYFEGMIHHQEGRMGRAGRAFQELHTAELSPTSARHAEELERLQDLAVLNIARLFYTVENFERAEQTYSQRVSRDSVYWPTSMLERAWAQFMRNDLNFTLGLLLTLHNPHYQETEFLPEATILRALTYFSLCDLDEVHRTLDRFEDRYVPMRDELDTFLAEYEGREGLERAEEVFEHFFVRPHPDSRLSQALFVRTLRNRDLASAVRHLDLMDEEEEQLRSQPRVWAESVGEHLTNVIDHDRHRYENRAGRALLLELSRVHDMLDDLYTQSELLRFEVVDAQRVDYEHRMHNPYVETVDERTINFAVSKDLIYWPFNGEFWGDELGFYRYTEESSC